MRKKGYSLLSVIIIVVVTAVISGITIGTILTKNSYLFVDEDVYTNDENLQEFLKVYTKVKNEYYEDIDSKKLIDGAIDGMLSEIGESYTTLLDESSAANLMESLNGTYEGIGITIIDHEVLNTVVGSPAEKSGILPGDKIVSVNGTSVDTLTADEISKLIVNSKDSVVLVINRNDTELTFNLNIETLNVPVVSYKMINDTNIGYMKVSVFSNNVSSEIETSLKTLKNAGMRALIIDLRGNNGGYLEGAYNSASLFLEKDKVVYSLESKNKKEQYKDNNDKSENIPIVVLINKGTASAAEILTAALKDSYGATVVGNTSYGKGKVQHTYSLSNGTIAKYTSSKWYTPNGVCIDGKGIDPDVLVDNEFVYDTTDGTLVVTGIKDVQYETAVKLLSQ